MNTNKLSKHYPTLEPAERLSLMLAAAARGDEVEHTRLADSAPWVTCRVPDTFGRSAAFLAVCGLHQMEKLNLAALYFKASGLADTTRGDLCTRFRKAARLYGYLVKIHADGWAQFCEQERLDPTICEAAMAGDMVLEMAEKEARLDGFTVDEAREYAREKMPPIDSLKTVESVVEELQSMHKMFLARWE
jgi:hypothetical protein